MHRLQHAVGHDGGARDGELLAAVGERRHGSAAGKSTAGRGALLIQSLKAENPEGLPRMVVGARG